MNRQLLLIPALHACLSAPAFAQDAGDWAGGYLGVYGGQLMGSDDDGDFVDFDTNLDGSFGDTVRNVAGANAFSPGFCDGVAQDRTPAGGCAGNSSGADFGFRGGYDWQSGNWVYGVVAEYGMNDARDAVSAFSITPARYTLLRKIDGVFAVRARVGFSFGETGDNLFYGTAGYARASVENFFLTSNGVNTFSNNGDSDGTGWQAGLGYERKFTRNFSVGIEYLATRLDDGDYRVRSQGPAPATNAFILVNANGTDFRRSDDNFDLDTIRLTANFRF